MHGILFKSTEAEAGRLHLAYAEAQWAKSALLIDIDGIREELRETQGKLVRAIADTLPPFFFRPILHLCISGKACTKMTSSCSLHPFAFMATTTKCTSTLCMAPDLA